MQTMQQWALARQCLLGIQEALVLLLISLEACIQQNPQTHGTISKLFGISELVKATLCTACLCEAAA